MHSLYVLILQFHVALPIIWSRFISLYSVRSALWPTPANAIHGQAHFLCGEGGEDEDERWQGHAPQHHTKCAAQLGVRGS